MNYRQEKEIIISQLCEKKTKRGKQSLVNVEYHLFTLKGIFDVLGFEL